MAFKAFVLAFSVLVISLGKLIIMWLLSRAVLLSSFILCFCDRSVVKLLCNGPCFERFEVGYFYKFDKQPIKVILHSQKRSEKNNKTFKLKSL